MNGRPTPETHAAFQKGMNGKQVFEFAEKLERERDEAREAATEQFIAAGRLLEERNELRNLIDRYRETLDLSPINWNT